jgi:hypothetical protein
MQMAQGQLVVKRIGHPQIPQFLAPPTEHQRYRSQGLPTWVLIHAQAAIVHELGGARENILNNFMHIKFCSVIDAIPLMDSPAIRVLILGTIACDHEPVSPSNFCGATGEATVTEPL